MNIFEALDIIKGLLHTFVRIVPIGLYFFTYFSTTLYGDGRAGILLLGLILNDLIGYIFKKYANIQVPDTCAVFGSSNNQNLNFLPNNHTEIMGFLFSFFGLDMYRKGMNWYLFNFLMFMLIITIWSRMSIQCENKFTNVLFNITFGVVIGSLYYYFMSPTYDNLKENKNPLETAACDGQYGDYTCETIKDGNVIIKDPLKQPLEDHEHED